MRKQQKRAKLLRVRLLPAQRLVTIIFGLYRDNGKENGNYRDHVGIIGYLLGSYIGIMEKKMETIGII